MSKIRILIVDDDGTLSVLARRLNDSGLFETDTEAYGIEAFDHAVRFRPHIIVVDYQLDKDRQDGGILTDGIVVIEKVRSEPQLARVPIILCSRFYESSDYLRDYAENNGKRLVFGCNCTVGGEAVVIGKIAHALSMKLDSV